MASYGTVLPDHPKTQTVFILGIVGIFVGICAPIAWYMGSQALKEVAANPGQWNPGGNLKTGKTLGMIFTILYIIGIVAYILFFIFVFAAALGTSGN
jgi:hypothetical protein